MQRKGMNNLFNAKILLTTTQYGDVFTFVLFGRRVTVALSPKGNNFILGGKSTVLNAEDAYTVLAPSDSISYTRSFHRSI